MKKGGSLAVLVCHRERSDLFARSEGMSVASEGLPASRRSSFLKQDTTLSRWLDPIATESQHGIDTADAT
jgi:hypothetical protein